MEEVLHFPQYTSSQLELILRRHAENAFNDGVLQQDVLSACAKLTAQTGGSVRRGKNLLYKAADEAQAVNSEQITMEHLRTGEERIRN